MKKNVHKREIKIDSSKKETAEKISNKIKKTTSVEDTIKHIKEFVKGDLKIRMTSDAISEKMELYGKYAKFNISRSTYNNAFTVGITQSGTHRYLMEILDLYIKEYKDKLDEIESNSPDIDVKTNAFSNKFQQALRERAGNCCSNPNCRRLTSGPSLMDDNKTINIGVACAIYGYEPSHPRYDAKIQYEKDDLKNGIWLCANDAQLVNQNNGIDFTAETLMMWKQMHEHYIDKCFKGGKKIIFGLNDDVTMAKRKAKEMLVLFNNRNILLESFQEWDKTTISIAIKEIYKFVLQQKYETFLDKNLYQEVVRMENALKVFYVIQRKHKGILALNYNFIFLKKSIGKCLYNIAKLYKLKLPNNLQQIAPYYENENRKAIPSANESIKEEVLMHSQRYGHTIQNMLSEYGIWTPESSTVLGDYGIIKEGCFKRIGHISEYLTDWDFKTKSNQIEDMIIGVSNIENKTSENGKQQKIVYEFEKNNGVLLLARNIKATSIMDLQKAAAKIAEIKEWSKKEWQLVTTVREAGRFILVMAGQHPVYMDGTPEQLNDFLNGKSGIHSPKFSGAVQQQMSGEKAAISVRLHKLKLRGNTFMHLDNVKDKKVEWVLAPYNTPIPEPE
jgi:hypothetical protein